MKSIRGYLLTRLLGGTALLLSGAGVVVYFVLARSIGEQFDRNLGDRVRGLASILFQVQDHVEFEFSGELMPEYEAQSQPAYFQLSFVDGSLLESSESLGQELLTVPSDASDVPMHWTAALPDGRTGRYVAQWIEVHHVYPETGPDRPDAARVLIVIARGRETVIASEQAALAACAAVALGLLAMIGALVWNAVGRGLAATERLARALDAIRIEQLPVRIDVQPLPRELQPVVETTNALIRRIDAAFQRERRTTADIAHELRTPISELLTVSEVALRESEDDSSARRALAFVCDAAARMGRSVATLLKLARLDMGAETFATESIDLGALVRDELRRVAATVRERQLHIDDRVGSVHVLGDPDVIRIIVANVIGNAVHYTPESSRVECRSEASDDGCRFVVTNDAGTLREDDLTALARPFWRGDSARADGDRSGLGLALSCALAEEAGVGLAFSLDSGRFSATLGPLAMEQTPHASPRPRSAAAPTAGPTSNHGQGDRARTRARSLRR